MIQETIIDMRLTWSFAICGLIVGMIGCHKSDSATSSTAGTGQSGGALAGQNHPVNLLIRDYAGLQQLIAAKRGKRWWWTPGEQVALPAARAFPARSRPHRTS